MDFIARERAMHTMKLRSTNPTLVLAVHRRALVRRIGLLTSRGWAQHIADRWRDEVSNFPTAFHTTEIDLTADEFLSNNPHRDGYHGMYVRTGALIFCRLPNTKMMTIKLPHSF